MHLQHHVTCLAEGAQRNFWRGAPVLETGAAAAFGSATCGSRTTAGRPQSRKRSQWSGQSGYSSPADHLLSVSPCTWPRIGNSPTFWLEMIVVQTRTFEAEQGAKAVHSQYFIFRSCISRHLGVSRMPLVGQRLTFRLSMLMRECDAESS